MVDVTTQTALDIHTHYILDSDGYAELIAFMHPGLHESDRAALNAAGKLFAYLQSRPFDNAGYAAAVSWFQLEHQRKTLQLVVEEPGQSAAPSPSFGQALFQFSRSLAGPINDGRKC